MRLQLFTISAATLLMLAGPAPGKDWKHISGKGRGRVRASSYYLPRGRGVYRGFPSSGRVLGRGVSSSLLNRYLAPSLLGGRGMYGVPGYGRGLSYGAAPSIPYGYGPYLPGGGYGGGLSSGVYQRGYSGPAPANSPAAAGQLPALADQLAGQAEEFLEFAMTQRGIVPESGRFVNDAASLRNAAARFRDASAQGADLATLRAEFGPIAAQWQQLEGRMARVNRGRIGPNISRALQMGQTVEQIGQLLP